MRHKSKKTAKRERAAKPARRDFLEEIFFCMRCQERQATETHEIPRGPFRQKAYGDRRGWLGLCPPCHVACGNYRLVPLVEAYRIKRRHDPEYFDLDWLNACRCRDAGAITLEDMDA